jgi:hypothetical protein
MRGFAGSVTEEASRPADRQPRLYRGGNRRSKWKALPG